MEVSKINGISELSFAGRKGKSQKHDINSYPQMDAPASKKSSKAMKALLYGSMALSTANMALSCDRKSDLIADVMPVSRYDMIDKSPVTDSTHLTWSDMEVVPRQEYYKDTVMVKHTDSITGEISYIPEVVTKRRDVNDTIINKKDTTIHSSFQPMNLKHFAFDLSDSLIAQSLNLGIPVKGPLSPSNKNNKILLLGAKAYDKTNGKFYEAKLDNSESSIGILTFYTKIVDLKEKDPNKQVSYMKTMVFDMNGQGIRLERFIKSDNTDKNCNCPDVPDYVWVSAGGETRMNNNDGTVRVLVTDKYGNPLNGEYGKITKGNDIGSFLFGSYVYEHDGKPCISCPKGTPVKVNYEFSDAKIYTTELQGIKKM